MAEYDMTNATRYSNIDDECLDVHVQQIMSIFLDQVILAYCLNVSLYC